MRCYFLLQRDIKQGVVKMHIGDMDISNHIRGYNDEDIFYATLLLVDMKQIICDLKEKFRKD